MNLALFGAGRIGSIHATNLQAIEGIQLRYISDPNPHSAQTLAKRTGAQVANVEEILADKNIDAVVIASSTDTHSQLLLQATQAGKHVFCEKPIDLSLERAKLCQQAVKESGITCMIGFQRRFDPTFYAAKQRLESGEIGNPEILIITSRDPAAPPLDYLKVSGGIFRDMLIHDFDICRWILDDEIISVQASASCLTNPEIRHQANDFDTTAVTLTTRQGRLCQINTSRRAAYGYDQRFEVLGERGMIQCANHRPTEVVVWNNQHISQDLPEHFFLQRYREAYRLEIIHFLDCLTNATKPRTSIDDGVAAQRIADAATLSAQQNKCISLEDDV